VKPVLPGYLADSRRRMTLVWLSLQMSRAGTRPNFDVYGEFGIPQWTQEFLRDRFAYFSATKDPRTDDAAIDLAEFLNADPTPFGQGIK
jgi:hypothetical protein